MLGFLKKAGFDHGPAVDSGHSGGPSATEYSACTSKMRKRGQGQRGGLPRPPRPQREADSQPSPLSPRTIRDHPSWVSAQPGSSLGELLSYALELETRQARRSHSPRVRR